MPAPDTEGGLAAGSVVMQEGFNAVIIDVDVDSRMRLKQVSLAVPDFRSVHQYNSTGYALSHIELAERCDVIFISDHLPHEEVAAFIHQAKQLRSAIDAAFVRLLPENSLDGLSAATSMREGFDGFLIEPYSINSLIEITRLATRVRNERAQARELLAMTLLVREIAGQIDIIAQLKAVGGKANISCHALRETCSVIKKLEGESRQAYFNALQKVFEEVPAPRPMRQKMYSGSSRALRERQERQMIEELKSDLTSQQPQREKSAGGSRR